MYIQDTRSFSLDSSTKRELIGDRLYIRDCILTSATVNEYLGSEISDAEKYQLDPNKKYGILRPLSELKKSYHTYDGMAVLHNHDFVDVNNPNKEKWEGTTGTNSHIVKNDLLCDVILWNKEIIDLVQNPDPTKKLTDLSCGYLYELVPEEGIHEGKPYHFKMINLVGNHLAVVSDGRVERAKLSDSNFIKGKKKMKKSALSIFMDAFFKDKKAMDNESRLKGLKEIADKDSEDFEGGEIEQAKAIIELARKIEASEKVEEKIKDKKHAKDDDDDEMMDNEAEEAEKENEKAMKEGKNAVKDRKGKDSEKEEDCTLDKEIETKEDNRKAMDSKIKIALQERSKVENLCTKVIGKISPAILADSTPEELITNTLKAKGFACDNKSYEIKLAMVEVLAAENSINKNIKVANDSIQTKEYKTVFEKLGV